jgi:hypothetical protein
MAGSFVVEEVDEISLLVVTGAWSERAEREVRNGAVDGLVLNHARGFAEPNLEFLAAWPIRHLQVLDRTVTELSPITRLAATLESVDVEAGRDAELDLTELSGLRAYTGPWRAVKETFHEAEGLEDVVLLDYDEVNLRPLSVQTSIRRVVIKGARLLESLDGIDDLPRLTELRVIGARELDDLSALSAVANSLEKLEFQTCLAVTTLDPLAPLTKLDLLGINDCGRITSLTPLRTLTQLRVFLAWESTRIEDGDLSPLLDLPNLAQIRMRDRPGYVPRLEEVLRSLRMHHPAS